MHGGMLAATTTTATTAATIAAGTATATAAATAATLAGRTLVHGLNRAAGPRRPAEHLVVRIAPHADLVRVRVKVRIRVRIRVRVRVRLRLRLRLRVRASNPNTLTEGTALPGSASGLIKVTRTLCATPRSSSGAGAVRSSRAIACAAVSSSWNRPASITKRAWWARRRA